MGVDADAVVVQLACKFFGLDALLASGACKLVCWDGMAFVRQAVEVFDAILVDTDAANNCADGSTRSAADDVAVSMTKQLAAPHASLASAGKRVVSLSVCLSVCC